jgi:predicted peroxiredoxin
MLDGVSLALKGGCDKVKRLAFPKLGEKLKMF